MSQTLSIAGIWRGLAGAGLCLCVALAGCAPKAPATGASTPPKKSSPSSGPAAGATNVAAAGFPKSKFNPDAAGAKDPFFPVSSRDQAANTAQKPVVAKADPVSLLSFFGTIGSDTERMAVVNGVPLELGRTSQIPIVNNGNQEFVKVKCLKIDRASVVLQVDGHPRPVVLRRK